MPMPMMRIWNLRVGVLLWFMAMWMAVRISRQTDRKFNRLRQSMARIWGTQKPPISAV